MSITIVPELSKQAAEQASELSRAISRDDKERKRSPVDDLEIASGRVDAATDQVERADQLWVEVATGHVEIAAVNNEIDTLLALLQKLDREGRFREELRVVRSLSRLLAVAMRWLDLLRTLHKASAAAERLGDLHAKAWALHELGTLHLAARDLIRADRELSEASELRRGLGEDRALMATERNLQVLCRTLRQGMREGRIVERTRIGRFLHVSNTLLVIMFLLVFGAATTAVAATGVLSSGGATAAAARVNQVLPASGPASGGTIVTITGTGLGHARSVRFGHRSGTRLKVVSVTQLQVTTPPGAGTVPVTVVTYRGKSLPRSTARFTYTKEAVPTIVAIAPASGPTTGGTVVTITGQNLAKTSQVRFGSRNGYRPEDNQRHRAPNRHASWVRRRAGQSDQPGRQLASHRRCSFQIRHARRGPRNRPGAAGQRPELGKNRGDHHRNRTGARDCGDVRRTRRNEPAVDQRNAAEGRYSGWVRHRRGHRDHASG